MFIPPFGRHDKAAAPGWDAAAFAVYFIVSSHWTILSGVQEKICQLDDLDPVLRHGILDEKRDSLDSLNAMCGAIAKLDQKDRAKLEAVIIFAEPENAGEICRLAENLDQFDFIPGVHTPKEYGKYMIQESGRFGYDDHLDAFYDYEGYEGKTSLDESYGLVEWQADALATALLMPLPQIKRSFYRLRAGRSHEHLVAEMARTFQVSKQAMRIRLETRNLI